MKILSILLLVIGSLYLATKLFLRLSPQFGVQETEKSVQRYAHSAQFGHAEFVNAKVNAPLPSTEIPPSPKESLWSTLWKFIVGFPNQRPEQPLEAQKPSLTSLAEMPSSPRLLWYGHSTFLVQINGKNLLLDPVFSKTPSPVPWLFGKPRYSKDLPVNTEDLPAIDAVLISHDHYDHLDYDSILALKDKVTAFYVPLGVGAHLERWGIPSERIHEMDWWEKASDLGLTLTFTPAQHFSGRQFSGQNRTLWGGWHIQHENDRLFFSGDTGYSPHFKAIRERLGPVDFALLECGQYNMSWRNIHMMPEETVQAAKDLQASVFMPIHWAAFTLSLHTWTEPVERAIKAADQQQQAITIPRIGEWVTLQEEPRTRKAWWRLENAQAPSIATDLTQHTDVNQAL